MTKQDSGSFSKGNWSREISKKIGKSTTPWRL